MVVGGVLGVSGEGGGGGEGGRREEWGRLGARGEGERGRVGCWTIVATSIYIIPPASGDSITVEVGVDLDLHNSAL
jgi:hypothetical protein